MSATNDIARSTANLTHPVPSKLDNAGSQIDVINVSKSYGAAASKKVVSKCSFTIERGKLTVMIGPSGCGKSTLIRLLAGFEQPSNGTITLDGSR